VSEEALMVRERRFGLPMFVRLLQDLETGHEAALYLIEHDEAPELDVSAPFVSRNDPRVGFKEAEDFLFRGDFLAFEHPAAGLGDHASDEWEELLHLISELLSPFLPSSAQCRRNPLRLLHHLFGDLYQVLIQLTLLAELLLALAP
jgi:hypothetical protein